MNTGILALIAAEQPGNNIDNDPELENGHAKTRFRYNRTSLKPGPETV